MDETRRDPDHRAPCHRCRRRLWRRVGRNCPRCTWVLCAACGGCGCNHPRYAARYAAGPRKVHG